MTTPANPLTDDEIKHFIADAEAVTQQGPWYPNVWYVCCAGELVARCESGAALDLRHIANLCPFYAIPLLRELLPLRSAHARLAGALQEIRRDQGRVCDGFDLCDHLACASSDASWVIADRALHPDVTLEDA